MLRAAAVAAPGRRCCGCGRAAASEVTVTARRRLRPCHAAGKPVDQLTGVVFQPFAEVQSELATVTKADTQSESLARVNFHNECEAAINEQINVEYNISYVYHSLYSYFDRDNVALPGIANFFKESSEEERGHAELLMNYQNTRGGRVKLLSIISPESEFNNELKGDALFAMELALSLEKLNFSKLRELNDVAQKHNDAQMCDFIEQDLLQDQVKAIKKVSEYVSQLRRVGKGLGVYVFDREFDGEAA